MKKTKFEEYQWIMNVGNVGRKWKRTVAYLIVVMAIIGIA